MRKQEDDVSSRGLPTCCSCAALVTALLLVGGASFIGASILQTCRQACRIRPLKSRCLIRRQVGEDGDVGPLAQSEQGSQYRSLPFCLIWHSKRVAKRVGNGQCPRGSNLARHFGQHGDRSSRDAPLLYLRLNQADRLMAEGSNRDQERDVDFIFDQEPRGFRGSTLHQSSGRSDGSHE